VPAIIVPSSKLGVVFDNNSSEGRRLEIVPPPAVEGTHVVIGNHLNRKNSSFIKKVNNKTFRPMIGGSLLSGCSPEIYQKLTLSLQLLVELASLYGFRPETFHAKKTLNHWQICSMECGWIKFMKYKLAAFMSYHLGNELPEKPFSVADHPNLLAGGSFGRFTNLLMKGPQKLSFAVAVLYSKKGMPKPGEEALNKAKIDTLKVLTTVKDRPDSEFSSQKRILEEISRTVREVFRRRITPAELRKPYAPSIRSNYTSTRNEFGTAGTLYEESFIMNRVDPLRVDSFYGDALEESSTEEIEDEDNLVLSIKPSFRKKVGDAYEDAWEQARLRAQKESANTTLVALPESLKVRVISKGPPLTYFVLKPVQKFCHRIMRKMKIFQLIGTPVSEKIINDTFTSVSGKFHSLDYSSATDLLDPIMSEGCVKELCDAVGLDVDLEILFQKALTGHLVEGLPQVWGQLMGSIVSFIILCLINAAVIRHCYEITTNSVVTLDECPALVNGDDGLVRGPEQFSIIWKSVARVAGLIPSIGKTYVSDYYLNINSTSYEWSSRASLIPYVNMGLVRGNTRSGVLKRNDLMQYDERLPSIGQRHASLMDSCPEGFRLKVHELFLKYNAEVLKATSLPWYVPEELGGIGLTALVEYYFGDNIEDTTAVYLRTSTGHRCGPSKVDTMIALSLKDKVHKSFSVRKVPNSQPIQARPVWRNSLKGFTRHRKSIHIDESDESFLDMSTYYMLPSLVMTKSSYATVDNAIRNNERAWAFLSKTMDDVIPEGDDTVFDLD
jgi:hypothetical protein